MTYSVMKHGRIPNGAVRWGLGDERALGRIFGQHRDFGLGDGNVPGIPEARGDKSDSGGEERCEDNDV